VSASEIAGRGIRGSGHRLVRLAGALRVGLAKAGGVAIGPRAQIAPMTLLTSGFRGERGRIRLGADIVIEHGAVLNAFGGAISTGDHVFIGPYVVVYGHGGVTIGDDCLVGPHCRILSSNHDVPPMSVAIRARGDILAPTVIGRDVWLGAGVTVLAGVTIGDGCVIGAGAVVADDLPPGAIAVGAPARVARFREGALPS